jgi:hypothetical protein
MVAMNAPARPRPHRRAAGQLLLGLAPLALVAVVLLLVLLVRLAEVRAPLAAATSTGVAHVVASGRPPGGRGVAVSMDDGDVRRSGVLVLAAPEQVPAGTAVAVAFDPRSPVEDTPMYADGDAAHRAVQDMVYGLVLVVLVLIAAVAVTGLRLTTRRRLRRAPATPAVATRLVARRGLTVRSWLQLGTAAGPRWLPVHWAPELTGLSPDTPITVLGDPARGPSVLPVVAGAEVWPSGRLRTRRPGTDLRAAEPRPDATPVSWGRQVRGDVVVVAAAPVLGLLWAYVDGSGAGGFLVATALSAALLFWLTELLGSDPDPPPR